MINDYEKIAAELMPLKRWQQVAFAAACAERVALILRKFGSPESVDVYNQALEVAWLGVNQQDLAAQAAQLIDKIENAPEAVEDVEEPACFAGRASNLLTYALEAQVKNEAEPATQASCLGMDFRSELDDILSGESQRLTIYEPNQAVPHGALEVLEFKHQQETLKLIKSAQEPSAELINSLRQLSQEASKELDAFISKISKEGGR